MGKGKRNRNRRGDALRWPAPSLEAANADVRDAERVLMEARRRAASAAASRGEPSPEAQAEEFFNRPGDFYIAQFEIDLVDDTGEQDGPIRAQTVLKADEAQLPYLVEVMRQIRGAFGDRARIELSRAQTQQQRVVNPRPTPTVAARDRLMAEHAQAMHDVGHDAGIGAVHRAAREAVMRRQQQAGPCPIDGRQPGINGADVTDDLLLSEEVRRDLTREELLEQLPGMTRTEVAAELGVDPADIGGQIPNVPAEISVEELAAELGVSPLDLMPIKTSAGDTVYAVKPRAPQQPEGRHARPPEVDQSTFPTPDVGPWVEGCECPQSTDGTRRTGTAPDCPLHGYPVPTRPIRDEPQA